MFAGPLQKAESDCEIFESIGGLLLTAAAGGGINGMSKSLIDWNHAYQSGNWDGCDEGGQMSRYALLGGLITLSGGTALLDVGCGRGLLREFIRPGILHSYTGVDISQAAIDKVADRKPHERFACARLEAWQPDQQYEVIVLNEVLYYLENPYAALDKMHQCLRPGGTIILSIYRKTGWRSPNLNAEKQARRYVAEKGLKLVEDIVFTSKTGGEKTWMILVIR